MSSPPYSLVPVDATDVSPPYPEDLTAATRHLCAGAYLDGGFRDAALREVYYQPRRLVAPSYGFDLVAVLGHCLRARNLAIARDAVIIAVLLVAALASWTALLVVVAVLLVLQGSVAAGRLARDAVRQARSRDLASVNLVLARAVVLLIGWSVAAIVLIWILGQVVASTVTSFTESPYAAPSQGAGVGVGAFLLAALVFLLPTVFAVIRQNELYGLSPGHGVSRPIVNRRMQEIDLQQRGNTVAYSGFWPFVGSGSLVDTWGFAQRLVQLPPSLDEPAKLAGLFDGSMSERAREFEQPPFQAHELLSHLRNDLFTLLPERQAEEHIPGLSVEDRVFLAGTEVSHLAPHTPPDVMHAVVRHPTTPARHYLTCQVIAWGGELVTTVYVHVAVQGRSLYLELTTTALSPCREDYRIVDYVEGTGPLAWLRAAGKGFLDTPTTIARAPGNLVRSVVDAMSLSAASNAAETTRLARGYDYGARFGVREHGSQDEERNLVQAQDILKYKRLIERRALASVLDFLEIRGVDTTEYRTRAATVLNVGVGNFGSGKMEFQASVIGQNLAAGHNGH